MVSIKSYTRQVRLDDGEWFDLRLVCGAGQRLVETRVELPLGVVMEEREGAGIVVCEVAPDSNSAKAVPRVCYQVLLMTVHLFGGRPRR
jgi:hypothetical protein